VYRDVAGGAAASSSPAKCLKRLHRELQDVMQLPVNPSIWLKYDEETPQFMRFVVAGPSGTPYAHGLFAFDMKIPNDYPLSPPSVTLLTTGSGRVRFGPNLYADGKVCLSLLGTWPGPKWSPKSTIQQLLISIQGLILGVDHPYYLEPGLGAWEGKVKDGQFKVTGHTLSGDTVAEDVGLPPEVIAFEDKIRIGTLKFAVADVMKVPSYLETFRREIRTHFYCNRDKLVREAEGWTYIPCFGYKRPENISNEMESLTSNVKAKLAALTMAELSIETATASQDISRLAELTAKDNDIELVSEQLVDVMVQDSDEDSKMPPTDVYSVFWLQATREYLERNGKPHQ
jgi:ubiquitin-protein ligase